ncbi:MAG TPA: phage tail tape measure protein [Nocardioidaceae bacterium]|nr:phage tail tape measure protein [Nocardioidaceae bacterium]
MPDNTVGARLLLRDKAAFIAGTREAAAAVRALGDETAASGKKAAASGTFWTGLTGKVKTASAAMVTAGHKISHFVTLPVLALGAAAVKSSTDFSTAMMRIHTQAGGSIKDVHLLSKQVLALSGAAQQGPTELARSLYHLKSVGMDNVSAMKALKQASDLAAVSGADLESTTNALAGAWRTGIPGAKNFHQTVSSLNAIVGAGNMTMEQLNSALGTGILPSAKTFGLTLKDVGAALALFTDEGVPANAAATRLRMSFSLLGAPSGRALKELKKIHLGQYELANDMRKKNGLVTAIGDLKSHLDASGLSASKQAALLSRAFGGGRSSTAILSLLNNYDVLEQKQKQVTRGASRFGGAVKSQLKTPQAQFKLLISTLEQLGVKLGNQLLPYVLKLVQWISRAVTWFTKLPGPVKKVIGVTILTVAALGPLLSIVGNLGKALVFLADNPVVLIIAAIAALVIGAIYAYKHFKTFRDTVNKVFADIQKAAGVAWHYIDQVWQAWGKPVLTMVIAILRLLWTVAQPVLQGIWKLWQLTWKVAKPILQFFWAAIKRVASIYLSLLRVSGRVATAIGHGADFIRTHWGGVVSFFKGIPGKIGGFFKGLGSIILSPFKAAFNGIARGWNDTVGKLSFKIPGWVPFVGGKGWSVPDIPLWGGGGSGAPDSNPSMGGGRVYARANGGTVHPGKTYFVGEQGVELFQPNVSGVIVPNYRMKPELNRQIYSGKVNQQQATGQVSTAALVGGGDQPITIQLVLDGKVISEAVYKNTRDKAARK